MPDLQPLVEDERERPELETVDALLGRRLRVRSALPSGQQCAPSQKSRACRKF
jgi:hypothetical protein